ncbi:MAG: 50S ribosomal protein L6 [bacterium]|nr:50S ribosomal protein L6 [bacterium]
MSRIGKKPVLLPAGIEATVAATTVTIKGAKQQLIVPIPPHARVELQVDPRALVVTVDEPETVSQRSVWGLTRQLLNNAVQGLQTPFQKALEFVGVGFKVALEGKTLVMDVGFSHQVRFPLPEGVEAKIEKQIVTLTSADKQLVGEMAASIRKIKPPEPYKGKGIKYTDEVIRRKAGKTAKTAS